MICQATFMVSPSTRREHRAVLLRIVEVLPSFGIGTRSSPLQKT